MHFRLDVTVSAIGLALTAILSAAHLRHLLANKDHAGYRFIRSTPLQNGSITFSKPPSAACQRFVLAVASVVATLAAFYICVFPPEYTSQTALILRLASWVIISFQELILVCCRAPQDRYRLGCYSAPACLALGIAVGAPNAGAWWNNGPQKTAVIYTVSTAVQIVSAVVLVAGNLSIPGGPVSYRNGKPVDSREAQSFLSRYTFDWARPILAFAARKKRLDADDLPLVGDEVRAHTLYDRFSTSNPAAKLWRRFLQIYWRTIAALAAIHVVGSVCHFLPQLLLYAMLRQFEARDAGANNQIQLWLAAAGLGSSLMITSWFLALVDWIADMQLSLPIHEQLFAVITNKAMHMKHVAAPDEDDEDKSTVLDEQDDSDSDAGGPSRTKHSILNLLGVDVESISNFATNGHLILECALQLVLGLVFLLKLVGWKATVTGCAIPVLMTPVYYYLTKKYSEGEEVLMEHRDRKSSVLTEAVRGIRQIKFSALEDDWFHRIQKLRRKELHLQSTVFWLNLALVSIWTFGPICMSIVSLFTYTYFNGSIAASIAFTAVAIFEGMENSLAILPEMVTDLMDASVSTRRIGNFLTLPDHEDDRVPSDTISFSHATVTWPSDETDSMQDRFHLQNLHFNCPTGQLTVLAGRSGAGKSLLLLSIVGEATVRKGTVAVPRPSSVSSDQAPEDKWIIDGSIAYVSQDPWIENATIRDAILFGLPFNPSRYSEVLHACMLTDDLQTFPSGDMTDIGANGINLSGGQKWRLAFARALYSQASILVLDDVFSAVDSHVGRHLYQEALTGKLCEGRTRILATHHVRLCLKDAALCVVLDKGRVLHAGSPNSLADSGAFEDVLHGGESDGFLRNKPENMVKAAPEPFSPSTRRRSSSATFAGQDPSHPGHERLEQPGKYYEEEKRETGAIKTEVLKMYVKACGGYFHWVLILIVFGLTLLVNLATPFWMSLWTRAYDEPATELVVNSKAPNAHLDKRLIYYLGVYTALSLSSWLLEIIRYRLVITGSLRASKVLFEQFTSSILRARLSFLDATPTGRILNRFTADFGVIDSELAHNLSFVLHSTILVVAVIVAALISSPFIAVFGLLSLMASGAVAFLYVTGAREAKRLESTARSPIFEQVGSLLTGLPTIRAFGKDQSYLRRIYDLIDAHCQALWHRRLFNCWMSFWLSTVGAGFVAAVAIMFVSIRTLDAPLAGFAMSFALEMSDNISWLLSQYAQLELDFNAAERITEYTRLEQEPQAGAPVPAAWPTKGEIEVTGLEVSYGPHLEPVLKSLTFSVCQGERIGVVGRTGAGKSSLSLALLRFLEPSKGSICIDGMDILRMRLHDVRSRVRIIPQDPFIFAGTVREVLDPFNRHGDSELRSALQKVHFSSTSSSGNASLEDAYSDTTTSVTPDIDIVNAEPDPLSFLVAEGGRNLSQGQRQLLCLARALVSRPKILIMDEATASVDMVSDAHIQRSIREEIGDCTVLAIAHRLSTIADFDRVMVLDKGRVVEFDRPVVLMGIEGGVFRGLVEESGEGAAVKRIIFGGER